jgi:hypothetical protein
MRHGSRTFPKTLATFRKTEKNLVDFLSQSVLNPEISSAPLVGATASLKVNW